jgi:hypothetical protein
VVGRNACVRAAGFTPRQARFLVLVLEHSGVCLLRQYRAFAGIAHGRQTHRFFGKLIAGGFATTDVVAPAHGGRIYRLQYKPWHRALGAPDHPHRRAMSVGRAVAPSTCLTPGRSGQDARWGCAGRTRAPAQRSPDRRRPEAVLAAVAADLGRG